MIFNPRMFSGNNLMEILNFYAYLIIGLDKDSFSLNGGTDAFTLASQTAQLGENSGFSGWSISSKLKSRGNLSKEILSAANQNLRLFSYYYHNRGLDQWSENMVYAKSNLLVAFEQLQNLNNYTQNYPLEVLIGAKREEFSLVFGQKEAFVKNKVDEIKAYLLKVSPNNKKYWDQL
ncbi:MAG: hypothetical protein C4K58_04405 [Flavobacteriaceae bacterium]|nr:MAG: hypothetical protein C4K58_04405 [Flavobacteriaceae bacterium]